MRIAEIDIERFRIWRSLLLRLDPGGLNVIYGPNEAGKTTLMQFVRSVLYGLAVQELGEGAKAQLDRLQRAGRLLLGHSRRSPTPTVCAELGWRPWSA